MGKRLGIKFTVFSRFGLSVPMKPAKAEKEIFKEEGGPFLP